VADKKPKDSKLNPKQAGKFIADDKDIQYTPPKKK
jgi:hypothetical protein